MKKKKVTGTYIIIFQLCNLNYHMYYTVLGEISTLFTVKLNFPNMQFQLQHIHCTGENSIFTEDNQDIHGANTVLKKKNLFGTEEYIFV